ncbi:CPBP family intramembrane glutamic endopeptidase [Corynebacterium urealyticum]|uniref:CPBP family intramembrane glutamic endopeptidase n=1 Tax=Corynebacterium urealyticum TaxID=43771 RepID=UPI0021CCC98C|nr:CPBP family intramembrane glutamic endopeptidase [Corynebacterium urealyticum]
MENKPVAARLAIILVPAVLGAASLFWVSSSPAGSASFYLATAVAFLVWLFAWLGFGDRRCFSPRAGSTAARELGVGVGLGVVLLGIFLLGALVTRNILVLAEPVAGLMDNMRVDALWATVLTLVLNGVGEELFFRDVARRALDSLASPAASLGLQVALYVLVTVAMGVPLLLVGSLCIGLFTALLARRYGTILGATALHLSWSTGMAFLLPLFF